MKKRVFPGRRPSLRALTLLLLLALLGALALPAAASSGETASLRVLGDSGNYPFEWYDTQTQSFRGIDVDILRMISEKSGLTFSYVYKENLGTAWEAMKNGEADILAGVYVDDALAETYHLTASALYTTEDSMAVIRKGGSISSSDALTVAVNASFIGLQEYLRTTHPDWTQVRADTFDDCLKLVSAGRADVTFIGVASLQKSSPLFDYQNLTLLSELTVSLPICLGLSDRLDPAVVSRINAAIAGLDEGDIEAAVLRNTAVDNSTFSARNFIRYHPGASALILAAFVFLAAAAAFLLYRARSKAENARQLAETNRRLETADRVKSEFLSRMSHDMRTPLNGILGMARIAREQPNPSRTEDCLAKIDTSARFLLGLISDLLDVSGVEAGRIELHPQPYPTEDFFRFIDTVVRPLCEEKGQELILETRTVSDRVPLLDPLRTNQIVFHLLSNAVKYTPPGGSVTCRLAACVTPAGRMAIRLEIADTGVGIRPELLPHIFEPFTQGKRDESSLRRGSGVGLYLVRTLTELMGGTVTASSEPGRGSSFLLEGEADCVPAGSRASAPSERYEADLAGRRILLCEDHPINQEIAKALLARRGMLVDCAGNGREGAALFRRSPAGYYDAILMDLRMPEMDGYEAARAIRGLSRPDAAAVPILALTADIYDDVPEKCREAGMNGCLAKPIEPDRVYGALSAAILSAQEQRAV